MLTERDIYSLYVVLNLKLILDVWLFISGCHVSSCRVEEKKKENEEGGGMMMAPNNVLHIMFGYVVQLLYCYWSTPAGPL